MTTAERIVRFACRLLPPDLHDWGEAMAQEAAAIDRPVPRLAFALGCVTWVLRHSLGQVLNSALTPTGIDPAPSATRRAIWGVRGAALTCAIAATGLGLVFLARAGAPTPYLIFNLAALIAGLIVVLPFRARDPVTRPFVGIIAVAVGLILILTALMGPEVSGARRWFFLGGVGVQPALIGLPFLLVAFARSRDLLTTAGLILAATALALQPDRAMAGTMVVGVATVTALQRDRPSWLMLAAALAAFAATLTQPAAFTATPFVDDVFRTAAATAPIAALAVWGGTAVLLLPALMGLRQRPGNATAHAVFGTTWLALITAALVGDHPAPVVAYGGSAIVGYLWSTLALPVPMLAGQTAPAEPGRDTATSDTDQKLAKTLATTAPLSASLSTHSTPTVSAPKGRKPPSRQSVLPSGAQAPSS